MNRLNIALLVVLIASGLALVESSYEARRLYAQLDRLQYDERMLEAERRRLDAERQAQATNTRVERVAREKLAMRPATAAVTHYVADGPVSIASEDGAKSGGLARAQ